MTSSYRPQATQRRANGFTALSLDRCAERRTETGWVEEQLRLPTARFLPLQGVRNLVRGEPPRPVVLEGWQAENLLERATACIFLGCADGETWFALGLPEDGTLLETGEDEGFVGLRQVAGLLDPAEASLLAYARAMVYWHGRTRFCGVCGSPARSGEGGFARTCEDPTCGAQFFPRTDPAIIVLVHSRDRCLLGRQPWWKPGLYSLVAGYVEPGEGLEAAVVREVREEVGLVVDEVCYHSSQPWPFPGSLMLGFTARARTETIRLLDQELEAARWVSREQLSRALRSGEMALASPVSIAYRLIEDWFDADPSWNLADWVGEDSGA